MCVTKIWRLLLKIKLTESRKGTGELQTYSFPFEGYNVHLVDTPGFNVSGLSL